MSDKTLRRNPDMSSIPAAGPAKALIVVTVSLHPGAAHHDPGRLPRPARPHPGRDRGPRLRERGQAPRPGHDHRGRAAATARLAPGPAVARPRKPPARRRVPRRVNRAAIAACESGGNWNARHPRRLLRRPADHRADLARPRRRPVRPIRQPGHPRSADRRGPAGPPRPGHRRLARVRTKGLTPPRRHLPALGSHQRGSNFRTDWDRPPG